MYAGPCAAGRLGSATAVCHIGGGGKAIRIVMRRVEKLAASFLHRGGKARLRASSIISSARL